MKLQSWPKVRRTTKQNGSLENARILDHLTPNIQRLLAETKVYQRQQNYRFCWVKNFVVLLRENEHSDIIHVTSYKDLEKLRQAGNTLAVLNWLKLSRVYKHIVCYLRYHILYYILEMATENSLLTTFPFNHLDDNYVLFKTRVGVFYQI